MAYIPKQLAQSNVASTSETTVYTVPTGSNCIIKQIVVANVTASAATSSISIVASGGTAGVTNRISEQVSIPANSSITYDLAEVMASGGFISVKQGTASALTTTISGVEFGSAAFAKDLDHKTRSAGNVTVNGTAYADVDTAIDLVLEAVVGDIIEVGVAGLWDSESVDAYLDVVSLVSGSPVTYLSGNTSTGNGVLAWTGPSGIEQAIGGGLLYTVIAGDLSSGTITLRLRARTAAAVNKTFTAGATTVFKWFAINHGIAAQDAIPKTLLDAKGDLIVASAADTAARLAVGANNTVLMADSAQATGAKWAGAYSSYTPTLTQTGAVTKTVNKANFVQFGKMVHVEVVLTVTGTGTGGTTVLIGLPVAANMFSSGFDTLAGSGRVFDDSTAAVHRGIPVLVSTTTVRLEPTNSTGGDGLGVTGFTAALAANDVVLFAATYEAA